MSKGTDGAVFDPPHGHEEERGREVMAHPAASNPNRILETREGADMKDIAARPTAEFEAATPNPGHAALIEKLEVVNRNILDEASRIGDTGRSYDSLLGEAAGVRLALRFVREAVEACTCEWNPACPEHGVTG